MAGELGRKVGRYMVKSPFRMEVTPGGDFEPYQAMALKVVPPYCRPMRAWVTYKAMQKQGDDVLKAGVSEIRFGATNLPREFDYTSIASSTDAAQRTAAFNQALAFIGGPRELKDIGQDESAESDTQLAPDEETELGGDADLEVDDDDTTWKTWTHNHDFRSTVIMEANKVRHWMSRQARFKRLWTPEGVEWTDPTMVYLIGAFGVQVAVDAAQLTAGKDLEDVMLGGFADPARLRRELLMELGAYRNIDDAVMANRAANMIDGGTLDAGLRAYLAMGVYDEDAGGVGHELTSPFVVWGKLTVEVAVYEGAFARLLTVKT